MKIVTNYKKTIKNKKNVDKIKKTANIYSQQEKIWVNT